MGKMAHTHLPSTLHAPKWDDVNSHLVVKPPPRTVRNMTDVSKTVMTYKFLYPPYMYDQN